MNEAERVRERYARRTEKQLSSNYNPLNASVYTTNQEKERALIRWIKTCNIAPVHDKRVLEIGCGSGANLLQLLLLGFKPENLVGNELLEDRHQEASNRLPRTTDVLLGDAVELNLEDGQFDIVYQSTVFTSILDAAVQQALAHRMWALTTAGGGVLWYDFIYDNPKNPDVKGIAVEQIEKLFPEGRIRTWRLTLAPPISRRVTKIHPGLYALFNTLPFLRTHVLCWIEKPKQA